MRSCSLCQRRKNDERDEGCQDEKVQKKEILRVGSCDAIPPRGKVFRLPRGAAALYRVERRLHGIVLSRVGVVLAMARPALQRRPGTFFVSGGGIGHGPFDDFGGCRIAPSGPKAFGFNLAAGETSHPASDKFGEDFRLGWHGKAAHARFAHEDLQGVGKFNLGTRIRLGIKQSLQIGGHADALAGCQGGKLPLSGNPEVQVDPLRAVRAGRPSGFLCSRRADRLRCGFGFHSPGIMGPPAFRGKMFLAPVIVVLCV